MCVIWGRERIAMRVEMNLFEAKGVIDGFYLVKSSKKTSNH